MTRIPSRESRRAVDWIDIRRRVDATGRALAETTLASPEEARAILEERARLLARPAAAPPSGQTLELLTFTLAGEVYALETRHVLAVFRLAELARLPGAELPLFGVSVWRGDLLTILDLRAPMGLSSAALNDLRQVLVLGAGRVTFGVLADAAEGIITILASDVRPAGNVASGQVSLVRGITDDAVLVLDVQKLFHSLGVSSSRMTES